MAGQPRAERLLLVVAHPDDESMFFGPALAHFRRGGAQLWILCLSNGNGDGLGRVRAKELLAAADVLRVPRAHVCVVDDARLQDGLRTAWPPDAVAARVAEQLQRQPCDAVLTFDAGGVSGHANHAGTHAGVARLLRERGAALGVRAGWQLVSEPLLVKYLGVAALPLLALQAAWQQHVGGQRQVLLAGAGHGPGVGARAMAAHSSQWVWFRRLFVLLSSYTYATRLAPLPVG